MKKMLLFLTMLAASVGGSLAQAPQPPPSYMYQSFSPIGRAPNISAVSGSSTRVTLGLSAPVGYVCNTGAVTAYVRFGNSAVVASATADTGVLAGSCMTFNASFATHAAARTASSTATVEVTLGSGSPSSRGGGGGSSIATPVSATLGGTGIANNVANTLTWSGAFAATFTLTGVTNVTFPTSGTLATTAQLASLPLSAANGGTGVANSTANLIELRNGVNPQIFRVYNTYTDVTTGEYGLFDWTLDTNKLNIGTDKGSGGGTARDVVFIRGGVESMTLTAGDVTVQAAYNLTVAGNAKGINISTGDGKSAIQIGGTATNYFAIGPVDGTHSGLGYNASGGGSVFTSVLKWSDDGTVQLSLGFTVAGLPACNAGRSGYRAHVTDALAPTFLATVVGGGAVVTPVFCNAANWVGG